VAEDVVRDEVTEDMAGDKVKGAVQTKIA